jgi:dienelactone hydrolase
LSRHYHIDNPHQFRAEYSDKAQWEKRAQEVRQQLLVANGLWPMPDKTPLKAVIHGKIERDEYTVEKVYFASMPGHYVTGNLYRPKGRSGKLPAVLCPHGHWNNGRFYEQNEAAAKKEMERGAEKTLEGAMYPLQARCAMLARMGCVVFHYDMVGYADSKAIPHRQGFTDVEADLRLQSFMGLQTWNCIRAMDFVTSLEDVDPARVAVTGASGGGTQTMILAAIDPRVAVSFPAVMVSANMQGGCICENAPYLRVATNNIEFAAAYAPRPQAMTGANDWTRDIEFRGLPELKAVYGLFGAQDKVSAKYYPFDHNYNQVSREMMYNWVNEHLKLGAAKPVTEKPFTPVKPAELSVFDSSHPRPADEKDAAKLRQWMTAISDVQLAELSEENPAEYRRIVSVAARVMTGGAAPGKGELVVSRSTGPIDTGAVVIERGLAGRRGTDEQIPYVRLMPRGWKGTVVIWAHPEGKKSLYEPDGRYTRAVADLLLGGVTVIGFDMLGVGESQPLAAREGKYANQTYGGFIHGYNRALVAERARDLLTVVGMARGWHGTKAVHVVASGKAGVPALLARAAAPDALGKSIIDLAGFDFAQVKEAGHEMMLPGALKYGGVWGLAAAGEGGQTVLLNAPKGERPGIVGKTKGLTLEDGNADEKIAGLGQ